MEHLDVFSARDLRNKSGELLRDAEAGQISLITKHGKPAILAVPFDERLINQGVHRAMALHLFESHQLTLAQCAKLAGLSLEAFIELLGEVGIPAVDYPPEELEEEMAVAL
jgi:prevent-host-death family protein